MKEKNITTRIYRKRALFQITKVLWHLDIFRRSFRELSGHACMAESCIFCALKELFSQLQSSHESALPPDALRRALAESFFDQQRFQLGFMDDAAECFENMLLRIHYHIASEQAEDMCNAKHCIPHEKFAMTLVEQSVCGACGATSEPLPFTQMVHYVSASALTAQARQSTSPSHPDLFGQLLKKAGGMGDIRDCPSACGAKIQIRRTLMNRPEIVSVGVVWDSDRPALEHIMDVLGTLRTSLRLSDVFHGCDNAAISTPLHQLVGVVTYYGKHYSTFFFHTKLKVWIYFDDATVKEIGPKWEQVVEKCRRGRYQPLLLLFAVPEGTPINTCNAPKNIIMATKAPLVNTGKSLQLQKAPAVAPVMGGRRSLTPSPEKPSSLGNVNQRRAVTPSPEQTNAEYIRAKTGMQQTNEYQNLTHIQASIFNNQNQNAPSSSSNSSPNLDYSMANRKLGHPERLQIQRRDSGNWSGDRNSASSSSSTSLENPYQYIMGKMQLRANNGVPRSPTSIKPGELSSSSTGSNHGDAGYDSYSLSSTDSLPLQHLLKHNLQLAQIPEGHQTPTNLNSVQYTPQLLNQSAVDDCERLCAEADQLLGRSEEADDLITALTYCNAAAGKARAAMDAPYSNPQTASFARMKHNTCIMRARSLHRKLEEPAIANRHAEGRHSREGSGCSEGRRSAGNHSRQNSKDKTNVSHSRQNSKELLVNTPTKLTQSTNHLLQTTQDEKPTEKQQHKNIEIYATLPKNKKGILSKNKPAKNVIEDEEYLNYERPGRTLQLNRNKNKKEIEKRAKSEEKSNKKDKDFLSSLTKDKKKEEKKKEKEEKEAEKKSEEKAGKKQHKIRRKLLMGGLIRRKNRSMPDLRDDEQIETKPAKEPKRASKDDTILTKQTEKNLSGYLSEGHLEYSGNPNLERSKLMRKSFYGSKMVAAKVPPPPPLRTTSQLSKDAAKKLDAINIYDTQAQNPQYSSGKADSVTYANGGILLPGYQSHTVNTLITEAQIHHESSKNTSPAKTDVDCVDGMIVNKIEEPVTALPLPPYPSPHGSVVHSRQPSEDFPPPPSLDIDADNQTNEKSFLEQLQMRKQQMLINQDVNKKQENELLNPCRQLFSESEILMRKQQNQQQIYQQQNQILTEAEHLRKHNESNDQVRRNSVSNQHFAQQQQHNHVQQQHYPPAQQQQQQQMPQQSMMQNYNMHNNQQAQNPFINSNYNQQQNYPSQINSQPYQQPNGYPNQINNNNYHRQTPPVHDQNPLNIESEKIRKQQLITETIEKEVEEAVEVTRAIGGETWLKELQAKQALLKNKRHSSSSIDSVGENNNVKDLKTKFEQNLKLSKSELAEAVRSSPSQFADNSAVDTVDSCIKRRNSLEKELKPIIDINKVKTGKKKNVTFCEQVVLVATAEENEDDSYIPNPILERVLRSVLSKDQTDSILPFREVTRETVVPLKRTDSMKSYTQGLPLTATQEIKIDDNHPTSKVEMAQNQQSDVKNMYPTDNRANQQERAHQDNMMRMNQSGLHQDVIRNPQQSQEISRLTQQSPVFSRPMTIPPHHQISSSQMSSSPLSSSPHTSSVNCHTPSPNSSLLRNSNPNARLQQNFSYPKTSNSSSDIKSNSNQNYQTNPNVSQTPNHNPNSNNNSNYSRSYSPQNGGFTTNTSPQTQPSPNLQQRSLSSTTHLPYAQHLQNSTARTQYQTKAMQQQALAAESGRTSQVNSNHNNSPSNTLTHSNSSSSLNSSNSSNSNPNYPTQMSNGHSNSSNISYNQSSGHQPQAYHQPPSNQNYPQGPNQPSTNQNHSTANHPNNSQNGYRPAQNYQHGEHGQYPSAPQHAQNGYKPTPNQGIGPYQPAPVQNGYHTQTPPYSNQNGHNTGSLNKIKQNQKPNPSIYQQNSKNVRPQGVYQQDLALPEYNPPPPAPGCQKVDGPYQKIPEFQRNNPEPNYPPYQKVPNLQDGSHSRVPNTNRSDPYQRVPNPQDSYQRVPDPHRTQSDLYQRIPNPQDLSQRGTHMNQDPYQRIPHAQDYNQRGSQDPYQKVPNTQDLSHRVSSNQDPYQRIPNTQDNRGMPNNTSPYQRVPNSQDLNQRSALDPYQKVPTDPNQRLPNHNQDTSQRIPNSSDVNGNYQRIPHPNDPYQRVPNPQENGPLRVPNQQDIPLRVPNTTLPDSPSYSPYQHPPIPRNVSDKSILRTTPSSNSNLCNLCRKKPVTNPTIYCADCDFYMSRFKPKTQATS